MLHHDDKMFRLFLEANIPPPGAFPRKVHFTERKEETVGWSVSSTAKKERNTFDEEGEKWQEGERRSRGREKKDRRVEAESIRIYKCQEMMMTFIIIS